MTTLLLAFFGAAVVGACSYAIGWQLGRRYGQDEQWVECVLELGRRDAARRDAQGRFRPASTGGRN